MGGTAKVIAFGYLVVVVIGVAISLAIAWSTLVRPREKTNTRRLAERERVWLVIVLVTLAVLLLATIFFTPYGQSAGSHPQVVKVTGEQFAWQIAPDRVRIDRTVEFRLRSLDVSHGFGLYSPSGTFLKQIQVIPDAESRLVYTFHSPGTYHVYCLEFCGLDHHLMQTTLTVTR